MIRRLLPLALLVAGCGGGGSSSFLEGSTGTVSLTFVRGADYNGRSAAISTYDALNGSAVGNAIDASVTSDERTFSVTALADPLVTGTEIDLAAGAGSSVTYKDINGQWNASSGGLTVQSRTSSSVTLAFSDVVLSSSSGGATGSVTINGTLTFTSG